MVVGEPLVVEEVVAERHGVRSGTAGGQEVRALGVDVFVVPLFRVAYAAERIGPVARVAARPVDQQRPPFEVGEARAGADEALTPL